MARKYELRSRAIRQDATRQKIVSAAVDLHCAIGPIRTSILAIAERAGVERPTVYRHFPTLGSLYEACSARFWTENPPPDPAAWIDIAEPEERLRRALGELYGFFERLSPALWNIMRDLEDEPELQRFCAGHVGQWTRMREILAEPFSLPQPRRVRLDAAIAYALDFFAWHASRRHSISNPEIIDLMVGMVRCL
ncbi:TetR/AcrR family transcriptional regulator [Rhodoplanes roseus]|uniref:HTH tetR-type domain-containing protein n=1 Tax=Rhodoplanes roseus TaxID=29409 RepID=A0A327L5F3_9BRAD|nr:TetR/AcrR family transcriptional regulator [Rhodoplanes roseus]RAI45255.1 hypothetical protein CH341_04905 [Rhodoplanes roseus]